MCAVDNVNRQDSNASEGTLYEITRCCGHVEKLSVSQTTPDPEARAREAAELFCYDCWEDRLDPPPWKMRVN